MLSNDEEKLNGKEIQIMTPTYFEDIPYYEWHEIEKVLWEITVAKKPIDDEMYSYLIKWQSLMRDLAQQAYYHNADV